MEAVPQWGICRRQKRPERVNRKGEQSPLQGLWATIEIADIRTHSEPGGIQLRSVRSIVAQTPWSGVCARFALTNSGRFLLCRTAHWADASFVCPLPYRSCVRIPAGSYQQKKLSTRESFSVGEPGGIRTHDLLIRSQTLYPAELRAHMLFLTAQV